MGKQSHGRMVVDTSLFERGGTFVRGYIAKRDLHQFGIRAGQSVSRRQAIQASAGGVQIAKLVEPRGWRAGLLRQAYRKRHGNLVGYTKLLKELDGVWDIKRDGLPSGKANQRVVSGWEEILRDWGLWDTLQVIPNFHQFWYGGPTAKEMAFERAEYLKGEDIAEDEDLEWGGFAD